MLLERKEMSRNKKYRLACARITSLLRKTRSTVHLVLYCSGRAPVARGSHTAGPLGAQQHASPVIRSRVPTSPNFGSCRSVLGKWPELDSNPHGIETHRSQVSRTYHCDTKFEPHPPTRLNIHLCDTALKKKGDWQSHVSGLSPRPVLVDLSTRWLQSSDGIWFLGVGYGQLHNR